MTTGKCDQKGCNHTVTAKNQGGVNRLIGLHKQKVHGIPGKTAKYNAITKAKKDGEPLPPVDSVVVPNFCPNCGCNLRVITAALNLRRKQ